MPAPTKEKMNVGNLEGAVRSALAENLSLDPSQLKPESLLREELGLDSFGAVELMFELEERSGLEIPDQDAQSFKRVSDIITYLRGRLQAKP